MRAAGRHPARARRLSIVILAFLVGLGFGVPVSQAATTQSTTEGSILSLMNKDRAARGLPKLVVDSRLVTIARQRAATLASMKVLSHTAAGNLQTQLKSAGVAWKLWGENLAMTGISPGTTAAGVLYAAWKGSPGHWALILTRAFDHVGVGVAAASNGATYASVVFIDSPGGSAVAPTPKPAPKAAPKPAPKPAAKPTPSPTPDPQLWIGDPEDLRPEGDTSGWAPWVIVAWLADSAESLAHAIGQLFAYIASAGAGVASLR